MSLRFSFSGAPKESEKNVVCPKCGSSISREKAVSALFVCPGCGYHMYIPAVRRLQSLYDGGKYTELFSNVLPRDPLSFPGYKKRLREQGAKTGLSETCVCAAGEIGGIRVITAVLDISFMLGSMGTAVGEKITLSAEYAAGEKMPLIIFSAGGGARMQEGIFALMQMIKTSAALKSFSDSGGLCISYITHPTTGGITASFASLGDITLAEPEALFGFAGPRVIEQTIGEKLPPGFQSSEFQLTHGFIDAIIPRNKSRETITRLLRLHKEAVGINE